MSPSEALMWRLESDPHLSSTFANVSILDRPADIERFKRRMERASIAMPRLRAKVQNVPLSTPRWVDDPNFDINDHVRSVKLGAPRSMRHLYDYANAVATTPFDRDKPLWEFVLVEGLPKGRGAIIQKIHHTITDGEGAVLLSLQFLDLDRDTPDPEPLVAPIAESASAPAQMVLSDLVDRAMAIPKQAAELLKEFTSEPNRIGEVGVAAFDTAKGIVSQLGDVEAAKSPLWTDRGLRKHLEVARVPFRSSKEAAKALGGTLNTFFVTAAADAAGRYHREHGAPVDELRGSMAISLRSNDDATANAFTLARLPAPTGDMTSTERFREVLKRTEAARESVKSASISTLAKVAAPLPTPVLVQMAKKQSSTVDFATSNVKAAPFPVYIAGALLQENYPIGPTAGAAFNLTLLSYAGSLDMGLNCDAAAIADPAGLRKHLDRAFADLLKAGGQV
jgi:diacylglycerol O-acyltransferase / wax synthase